MTCPSCGTDCTDCDIKRIYEKLVEQLAEYERDIGKVLVILKKHEA